jgi:DNA-binding ferritin-like protein
MNANELADALDKAAEYLTMIGDADFKQAATMLRQQQAEIEALKQSKSDGNNKVKELTDAEIRTIQDMCHLKNVGYNTFIMRFARAILRKASEK